MEFPVRINKFLAHKGYTTRQGADELIRNGCVFINGKRATLGQKVLELDSVEIEGFKTDRYRYLVYYKPRGVVTHSSSAQEVDIETLIRQDHNVSGVFPVGRLDKDSEGLILLTDDGRITERILNPKHAHEREYEVTLDKRIPQTFLNRLEKGVSIEGYRTKPAKAIKNLKDEHRFKMTLTEGKKHQIRRMCAAYGYQVKSLKRTRLLHLGLRQLKPGRYYALNKTETTKLKGFLKIV